MTPRALVFCARECSRVVSRSRGDRNKNRLRERRDMLETGTRLERDWSEIRPRSSGRGVSRQHACTPNS
eukprot:6190444-Pleurochrysis_carterae.AAC.1